MMKKILIGNWKNYLNHTKTVTLAHDYLSKFNKIKNLDIVLAPNSLYLYEIKKLLNDSPLQMASQNASATDKMASTGESPADLLRRAGCRYAIIGHSERRRGLNENDDLIKNKLDQCYEYGLLPILCIGELKEERENGKWANVLTKQIGNVLNKCGYLPENRLLIAYEPAWAIGTGDNMSVDALSEVQRLVKRNIAGLFSEKYFEEKTAFLYGGSVNAENCDEYWAGDFLDGMLIGKASTQITEMEEIVEAARRA